MRTHGLNVRPDRVHGVKQLLFADAESRAPILALPHIKNVYTVTAIIIAATESRKIIYHNVFPSKRSPPRIKYGFQLMLDPKIT